MFPITIHTNDLDIAIRDEVEVSNLEEHLLGSYCTKLFRAWLHVFQIPLEMLIHVFLYYLCYGLCPLDIYYML